jgi:hypothetical protein
VIVVMKTIANDDDFHEKGSLDTARFFYYPFSDRYQAKRSAGCC